MEYTGFIYPWRHHDTTQKLSTHAPGQRDGLLREGGTDVLNLIESQESSLAGDQATAWEWLQITKLSAVSLKTLNVCNGAQFIRDMGFDTSNANAQYGAGWLNQ